MPGLYLAALGVSVAGMIVLDRRFGLFFWSDARRAAVVYVAGMVFFLIWDLVGVATGVFFRGDGPFLIGAQVAPEVPVEELLFLTLLIYSAMNVFGGLRRWRERSRADA